ncbi:hypothetical protein ES703_51331 [subsurface metagenome]
MDAPFTDQQLITLYKKGMKDREIAAELGVKRNAVKHRRRKLDLLRTRLFTDQQLIDLHREGLTDPEKAERLGASDGAVFYHRRRLGLKANKGKTRRKSATKPRPKKTIMEKKKQRFSVTLTGAYIDRLNLLVEKGLYLDHQDAVRDALRRLFQHHGMKSL